MHHDERRRRLYQTESEGQVVVDFDVKFSTRVISFDALDEVNRFLVDDSSRGFSIQMGRNSDGEPISATQAEEKPDIDTSFTTEDVVRIAVALSLTGALLACCVATCCFPVICGTCIGIVCCCRRRGGQQPIAPAPLSGMDIPLAIIVDERVVRPKVTAIEAVVVGK
jgi:hypothetical protein